MDGMDGVYQLCLDNDEAQRLLFTMCSTNGASSISTGASQQAGPSGAQLTPRSTAVAEWTDGETKLLLDKYGLYLEKIGPLKRFKNRKSMFQKISQDILSILGTEKTHIQCENRVKTILRRKRHAIKNNSQSGASPLPVPYQEELQAILRKDDSIDPEILRDAHGVTYRGVSTTHTAQGVPSPTVTTVQASTTQAGIVIPDPPQEQELAPSNEEGLVYFPESTGRQLE
ncbi:uncharacterized protein LOC135368058 [Ornithodoros turicata]|uniref:uncharacterized protein LOC135368058 n=1 Tax=Ornithodoros turicata TaxID=34597 RepID=UPI003139D822